MADLRVLVDKLRRSMNDYVEPSECEERESLYSDQYYSDAAYQALDRFNCDTGSSCTIEELPDEYVYIVCLLGQINMAKIRFTRDQQLVSDEPPEAAVQRVQVPGLEVWFNKGQTVEASSWRDLIKLLEAEYQKWLELRGFNDRTICELPAATSAVTFAKSRRRHGAYCNYLKDPGITDSTTLCIVFVPDGREFTWDIIRDSQFNGYVLERRIITDSWAQATIVASIMDPHCSVYLDTETLLPSTYQYRLRVRSKNGIYTDYNSVTVRVA